MFVATFLEHVLIIRVQGVYVLRGIMGCRYEVFELFTVRKVGECMCALYAGVECMCVRFGSTLPIVVEDGLFV
jgi:hypothetical protein